MITLRHYQQEAVESLREAYRNYLSAPLLVMPTGAGKTVVFTYIASSASTKGNRVLMLAHRQELIRQISKALTAWKVSHGIVAPGHPLTDDPIQVGSVQTVARRLQVIKHRFNLIVIDEAHHVSRGSQWGKVLDHWGSRILGVTATPQRLDGKGLGRQAGGYFDTMVMGPSVQDLIDQGHLCPPVIYAPPPGQEVDLSAVKISKGDFDAAALADAMDKPSITGDVVGHYRRLAHGVPAIAFTATVEHADHVAEQFRAGGYRAESLSGTTPSDKREKMIADLGAGLLDVIASCNVISEGTDVPRVGAAMLLRPTQSLSLHLQQVGRALRTYPGKERAIILDHAGNTARHGFPTDPLEWSLDGSRGKNSRGEKTIPVRQCPGCYATWPGSVTTCRSCGHVFKVEAKASQPDTKDGELVEQQQQQQPCILSRQEKQELITNAKTLGELYQVAKRIGYKRGWAWVEYNRRKSQSERSEEAA